ncbi:MAG: flagellin [Clostridiaceae bacterium]|nr:flagellin [Clostridiaceae bacterium]
MIINHNMNAANALRNANINMGNSAKSMEKLSSGLRINRAGDDAAGLSISEKMRAQIRGLEQASTNAQDGISMIQTAEGALNETHNILQRMRELSVQAANDTNVTKDREAIKSELDQLSSEITRIAENTEFNKQNMFDGSVSTVTFQVGANNGQTMTVGFENMDAASLTVNALDVTDNAKANESIVKIDTAIEKVSSTRSSLGAVQNRLEHTIANLDNASENLTSAESRIRDVDMAKEMSKFSKNNILQQAAQAMLVQANQTPQQVLQLLR